VTTPPKGSSTSRRPIGRGKAKRPPVVLTIPENRRIGALASAFRRAFRTPLIIANTAGGVAGFIVIILARQPALDLPLLAWAPAAVGTFAVIACLLLPFLVRGDLRAALETFAWIGRWDALRWREVTGVRPAASPEQARDWLEANPIRGDAPALQRLERIEPLLMVGDVDTARKIAAGLPVANPWDRFEALYQRAFVDFTGGVRVDPRPIAAAAAALTDEEERLRAAALLAVGRARLDLAAGKDWIAPLAEARPTIGQYADGVLRLEIWPTLFRLEIVVAVVAGAMLALIVTIG
jgi:hypothetical protein